MSQRDRRFATYLFVQDLLPGARVLDLGDADAAVDQFLAEHGAKSVSHDPAAGPFDLVLAPEVEAEGLMRRVESVGKLAQSATLVIGVRSADCPTTPKGAGATYYQLVDALEASFGPAKMIGVAPFAGVTLAEYGLADPEPVLDGTLVPKGERVEWYLAVVGAGRDKVGGYGVVQLPVQLPVQAELVAAPVAVGAVPPRSAVTVPVDEFQRAAAIHAQKMADAEAQLAERDAYIAELRKESSSLESSREHLRRAEGRADEAESRERQARRQVAELEGKLLKFETVGAVASVTHAPAAPAPVASATIDEGGEDLRAKIAQLEVENQKLKEKEAEARSDSWKHLKARSEAEQQAAEVREDTVRKLKDARKLASVELMRAMEEATKKAVSLRDELNRTERERKDSIGEVKRLQGELEALRLASPVETPPIDPEAESAKAQVLELRASLAALEHQLNERNELVQGERARAEDLEELVRRLEAESEEIHRRVAAGAAEDRAQLELAEAEKDRFARLLADVERESKERSERALKTRQTLREKEREVEALRREIRDRDAKLNALERRVPPRQEMQRIEAELQQARTRLLELSLELARKDAEIERARSAVLHERQRAERLVQEERQAIAERNELRSRVAESETQLEVLAREKQRLERDVESVTERARKAEGEMRDRGEQIAALKRELTELDGRTTSERDQRIDGVRQRLHSLEGTLAVEVQRLGLFEDTLQRVAAQVRSRIQPPEER